MRLSFDWPRIFVKAVLCCVFGVQVVNAANGTRDFEDWSVSCGDDRCSAIHRNDVLKLEVLFQGTQRPVMFFHVARESKVGHPIAIRLNDGRYGNLEVNRCFESHCSGEVNAEFTTKIMDPIDGAESAVVAYLVGKIIVLTPVSFKGFQEAIEFAQERSAR